MRHAKRFGILAAAALLMVASGAAAEESCAARTSTYRVSLEGQRTFAVRARLAQATSRLDLFWFAVPGRPEGQAESIADLVGVDDRGEAVALTYVGEGGWEAPAGRTVTEISYSVVADHDEVDWGGVGNPGKDEVATHFDNTFFFVGHAFFLVDFEAPPCPIAVSFDLPETWHVTSPWPMEGAVATASGPWNLAQNAFAMGTDEPTKTRLGGMELTWLIADDLRGIEGRVVELLSALPQTYAEFFGGTPGQSFAVFFFPDDMSDGGAFQDSFAMRLATPVRGVDEITWSHTLGHEVMHLWNGAGAIRGENPEQTNWLTEGFTDYLTIKLMRAAGFLSDEMLEQRVANVLRRYEIAKKMSPEVPLFEATKGRADNWFLIYGGGALVALLLDAELSREGADGFRNLMRDLYADSEEPYSLDRLLARMNAASGGKAEEFIAWIDGRPSAAELRERLFGHGVEMTHFGMDEFYVRFPEGGAASTFLKGPTR